MVGTRNSKTTLIVIAVFAIVAVVMAKTAFGEDIWHQISVLGVAQILMLLVLSLGNYLLRAMRWHMYTNALSLKLRTSQVVRHYVGGFALTMTPGRLGEIVRLRWITRETGRPFEQIAPLVLVDRAGDLASTGFLLAVAVALSAGGISGGLPIAVAAIGLAFAATRPRVFEWATTTAWRMTGWFPRLFVRMRTASRELRPFSQARVFAPALAVGALGWMAECYAFYLLLGWMGVPLGLWTCTAIFLFAMMTGGATGMPGGVGGAEATMIGLLSLNGVPLEISIPATAIIRITTLWFAVGLGVIVFPLAEGLSSRTAHALKDS